MINYIASPGISEHLSDNGYYVVDKDGVWLIYTKVGGAHTLDESLETEAIVQALIDNYSPLEYLKVEKENQVIDEAVERAKAIFPTIDNIGALKLEQERWLSIQATARSTPTTEYQKALDIYTAATGAVTGIKAEKVVSNLEAYDVTSDPAWPV